MTKYNIGDKVWLASVNYTDKWITCPDCFGRKFLTVIMGDDSRVTIDCAGCSRGYEPSRGVIHTYAHLPKVSEMIITGMISEIKNGAEHTEYRSDCYCLDEENLFNSKVEAELHASVLAKKQGDGEFEKLQRKERDTRTWSWNAHYHRDLIRRAKKDIGYHEAKLTAALRHVKEEKVKP